MIEAYKKYWKGYVDFSGTTSRRDYWLTVLAGLIVSLIISIINALISTLLMRIFYLFGASSTYTLTSAYTLATIIPSLAIIVRRLRDAGKKWTNIFWFFLPLAGPIILIVFLCKPSVNCVDTKPHPAYNTQYNKYQKPADVHEAVKPDTEPVKKVSFCHKCGARLQDNAKFCTNCGQRRFDPSETAVAPVTAEQIEAPVSQPAAAAVITEAEKPAEVPVPQPAEDTVIADSLVPDEVTAAHDDPAENHEESNNAELEPEEAPCEVLSIQQYMNIADQYAHIESLFADNPEKKELEAKLLSGGANAKSAIMEFLLRCGMGISTSGWWNGAASLTRMIRTIGGSKVVNDMRTLKDMNTSIWEYHTQIADTANKELASLMRETGGYIDNHIPDECARGELLMLQNVNPPKKRLEQFFSMQDSAENWSDSNKAFLYFIAGGAAHVVYPESKSNLAFYAAQVFCDPNPNSMGWQHLRDAEGATLPATPESAQLMHKKYPLPKSMVETANYTFSLESENNDYTLDKGLNELIAVFESGQPFDEEKIKDIGQKIYGADIPLVSGVGGMHQLFILFKNSMPMFSSELSRIWDGIGDWAD